MLYARCLGGGVAMLLALACSSKPAGTPEAARIAALERTLHDGAGAELDAAAAEYRELMGERPEALRTIAAAYRRVREQDAELDVLRTLVLRDQATEVDRLRVLDILIATKQNVTAETYVTGLAWLDATLAARVECATLDRLVAWTEGHPEHEAALDRALAGCPRDHERAKWFASRARLGPRGDEDACDAVLHGNVDLARRCVERGQVSWKVEIARAVLGDEPLERLRSVRDEPEVTPHVLVLLARAPGVSNEDACAALTRARTIELGWIPVAGDAHSLERRYAGLRRHVGCP